MGKFHKFLFQLGAKLRNPSLFSHFSALKVSEKFNREKLLKLNEDRLRENVIFASENSPFYKDFFAQNEFDPKKNWSLDKFNSLPVVTKTDLIEKNTEIHTPAPNFKKLFFCETSGTSGQILTFQRDESWDSFNRASIWRGYSWFDVNPWDYRLYFWGYNTAPLKRAKLRVMDFLVNRFRVFDYDEKKLLGIKSEMDKIKVIEGYSSMIYELANLLENKNVSFSNLKMVKGTSEKIFPHYQGIANKVYKKNIISEYGSAESGIIAFECPSGNMHLNMEGVYVTQDPFDGGIIVTNLQAYSFPVIRYKLGDAIRLAPKDFFCPCGREHPVLEEVTGRIGKNIFGKVKIYPSLTFYYVFKNIFFNQNRKIDFQAHQFEKGKLEIWVKEKVTEELTSLIQTEALNYFQDLEIAILEKYEFRQQSGKLRDFISHIP